MALQHIRSSTANKRPVATNLADGQISVNYHSDSPGIYAKDTNNALFKVGPIHVGTTAPNSTPAGSSGNSRGEGWLDTSGTNPVLKVWNGTAWATVQPVTSGTVVSTADTGTVTSTMIADGTITNTDINASAAIALSKLATGALPTGITVASANLVDGTIVDADINASAAIAHSKLASLTAGNVLLGNASSVPTSTAVTGDVTISSTGVTAIAAGAVVNADISNSAAIAHSKLANITAGQVLLGNASNVPTATALSGDVTVTSTGVTSIKSDVALTGAPTAPTAGAGTNTTQIATTAFVTSAVDAARQGLTYKQGCRVATTGPITLSGTQTIDGVAVAAGERVLVKNQSTASENGIYLVAAGAWSRATDFDASADLADGAFVFVEEGTANADTGWVLSTDGAITVGTTALTFVQFSGAGTYSAGNGLQLSGTQFSLAALPSANLLIGNSSNVATATAVTGDVTISNTGVTAIGASKVTNAMLAGSIADSKLSTISTAGKVANSATTATNLNTASAIVARDASGNFSAGTITATLSGSSTSCTGNSATATALSTSRTFALTGDVTGSVSSDLTSGASILTTIAAGVIVDADVNASAAIAGTKISPDFGSQAVTTTGTITGASLIPTSSTAPTNGIYLPAANSVGVSTASTERLRVDSSGRLLVGSTTAVGDAYSPVTGVRAVQFIGSTASFGSHRNDNTAFSNAYIFTKARGVNKEAVLAEDNLGIISFQSADGTTFNRNAGIEAYVDGTPGAGSAPGRLAFYTTPSGSGTPVERMRIRSDGNIAIKGTGSSFATLFNQGPITGSASTSYGNFTNAVVQSDVTSNAYGYSTYLTTAAATFTLANLHHYNARQTTLGAGSTITNQYGFIADASLTGAGNNFGFYANLTAATGRWNFFANGTANNYFAGSVGIGTIDVTEKLRVAGNVLANAFIPNSSTVPAQGLYMPGADTLGFSTNSTERMRIRSDGNIGIGGSGNSVVTLHNQGAITGGTTAYGNFTQSTIQSDVTVTALGYATSLTTAAAAFTLSALHHFTAQQSTFGAGSTVTTQYGFVASSNLTGATNNYGFYGNIPSGTGRWNFFAAGTADNYFAGDVGIGTTSIIHKLTVSGSILTTGNFVTSSATGGLLAHNSTGYVTVSGDTAGNLGANVLLYGGGHATAPARFQLRQGTANVILINDTGNVLINTTSDVGDKLYVNGSIRSNGQISTGAGDMAAAPGFTWAGDENTGMFRNAIDSLAFSAGGTEVCRVNANGTSGRRQIYFPGTCEVWSSNTLFLEGVTDVRSVTAAGTTTTSAANVFINSTSGLLQRSTSSIKYKTDVEDAQFELSEALVYNSRPVWYRSTCPNDNPEHSHWGFIAEEVAQIDPRMIHWGGDDGTEPEGVQYDRYVVHLVKIAQEQKALLDQLQARIEALESGN